MAEFNSTKLCALIEQRPDNHLIESLVNYLNETPLDDHRQIFVRCGQYLSGINLDKCFQSLIDRSQEDFIRVYIEQIDDLPEDQMVRSLNVSLDYLMPLMEKSFDYWSLSKAMKIHLNSSKSVELAEHLFTAFVDNHRLSSNVLDWLCALIDSHFSSFVLAKWNKIDLIEKLVQHRLTTFDLLQGVNKLEKNVCCAPPSVNNRTSRSNDLYSLQRVHFK